MLFAVSTGPGLLFRCVSFCATVKHVWQNNIRNCRSWTFAIIRWYTVDKKSICTPLHSLRTDRSSPSIVKFRIIWRYFHTTEETQCYENEIWDSTIRPRIALQIHSLVDVIKKLVPPWKIDLCTKYRRKHCTLLLLYIFSCTLHFVQFFTFTFLINSLE